MPLIGAGPLWAQTETSAKASFASISAGSGTCAVLADGRAFCWGAENISPTPTLVALPGGRRAVAISAGSGHRCAILDDGSAVCWGQDEQGQLGDDAALAYQPTPVPVALPPGRTATQISAGGSFTCAVLDDGSVVCWGRANVMTSEYAPTPAPVPLPAGRRAVAVSTSGEQHCLILDDGSPACWGITVTGSDFFFAPAPTVVPLPAGRTAVAISSGGGASCVVLDDGSAACWGIDAFGQLGNDSALVNSPTPVPVALPAGRTVTAISAGDRHGCAVLDDGSATCWGSDGQGRLGDGANSDAPKPIPVPVALPAGRRAVAITAGDAHSCAILDDQTALCWGNDRNGQLGNDPTIADRHLPVLVALSKTAPARLTLTVTPDRDVSSPHLFSTSGQLVLVEQGPARASACNGNVAIKASTGTRTLATSRVKLRISRGKCIYSGSVSITAAKRGQVAAAVVIATFSGNDLMLAATARPRTIRFT
ncbi:MAG: hypothetical protein R3C15_17935 [Thermoleophilia bacterium]